MSTTTAIFFCAKTAVAGSKYPAGANGAGVNIVKVAQQRLSRMAGAALVSEADFIAVQEMAAPRGPAGPAARRYLLAGLLACGRCGRRLESAWSNGKPAYRCRHGHTRATALGPGPGRAKTTYVREAQILPHLAAISILLAGYARTPGRGSCGAAQVTGPADTAGLIDQLRAYGLVLTYDPEDQTLRAGRQDAPPVTIGNNR